MTNEQSLRHLAARIGGQAQLLDIRTRSLNATLDAPPEPGYELGYELETDLEHVRVDDRLLVEATYSLEAVQRPPGEAKDQVGDPFAVLGFSLLAIYDLPTPKGGGDYSDDEFHAFAQTTVQFALYPYVRELVQSLTSRLAIPPLTLGTMRLPLEPDEVSDAHPGPPAK